jgi:hypothetical protein
VELVRQRRKLCTELLRPYAGLVLNYDEMTKGKDLTHWKCDELCDLLEVDRKEFVCSHRKAEAMIPANIGELCQRNQSVC